MKTDDATFYLGVNNVKSGSGEPWFKKAPVGVNKLNILMKTIAQKASPGGEGVWVWGVTPHMKHTGMLVVSLRGVNFGFWSRLGCSEQSANILSRQGLV